MAWMYLVEDKGMYSIIKTINPEPFAFIFIITPDHYESMDMIHANVI